MRVYTDLQTLPSFRNAVVTIGSFDGVHHGHRLILKKMHAMAQAIDGESVVITFDPHPRTVLNSGEPHFKLITTTAEKIAQLKAEQVDHVVVAPFTAEFAGQSAEAYVRDFLVQHFQPKIIVIGYDHRFGNKREGNLDTLRAAAPRYGFEVVEIPAQQIDEIAVSSSKIRKALEASDIRKANRLLGHPYGFLGEVQHGDGLGRKLGFPTANLAVEDPYKLILPPGIYAARARVGERRFDAMLYIGYRPSIEGKTQLRVEVNLLDFDEDLYGQVLSVEVLDFVRGDQKFDSLEALVAQIAADKTVILQRLAELDASVARTDVAIVILNYNTRRHLESFLPSVVANSPGARVIVADNGSPDDSIAFLREKYPDVELLDLQQNYGFAQGYNEALRQVDADIYVVLNSDVEVTPGWMAPILDAMQRDERIAIAQPKIKAWRDKDRFEYAGASGGWIDALGYPFCRGRIFSLSETDAGQYDTPQACFWAAGAAFFIRAKLYHDFGGFDGDYFAHNEEIDLCWRIKRAGYGVWCFPQSVVYHLGGGTLEYENPRKVFLNFRNSLFTLLKNESAGTLIWLIPARFLLDGLAGVRFLLKGQFAAIGAIIRAHFSFYKQWGATLNKRRAAAETIARHRIDTRPDRSGIYRGSIVWAYYARGIRTFKRLFSS